MSVPSGPGRWGGDGGPDGSPAGPCTALALAQPRDPDAEHLAVGEWPGPGAARGDRSRPSLPACPGPAFPSLPLLGGPVTPSPPLRAVRGVGTGPGLASSGFASRPAEHFGAPRTPCRACPQRPRERKIDTSDRVLCRSSPLLCFIF